MPFKLPDPERKLHEEFADVAAAMIPYWQPAAPAGRFGLSYECPAGSGQRFAVDVRLTPLQDLLLCNIEENSRPNIEQILKDHGVLIGADIEPTRRLAMACPALPTCGLAITESERAMPALLIQLRNILKELNLADQHPHDGLPEWMHSTVCRGSQDRRKGHRQIHALSWRQHHRHTLGFQISRHAESIGNPGHAQKCLSSLRHEQTP